MRDDGGPAFPLCRTEADGRNDCLSMGMSLRDWFAGHATEEDVTYWLEIMLINKNSVTREEAKYMYADAMIAERSKEAPNG